ncbi:hypothetical protein CTAYLR_010717 [Chrysophaeum taylorii]|uniref:Uncharacterized protein n=1 Tax=Chrysophaeum taylorii TaxID=2483200 RepID=A0AAD7U5X1_9STRA|nr:hypothetical protein CTAYLR_010717 [Chrysophaeum taylorii]
MSIGLLLFASSSWALSPVASQAVVSPAKSQTIKVEPSVGRAKATLAPDLYEALTWTTTIDDYLEYLAVFARWIPQQSSDPA